MIEVQAVSKRFNSGRGHVTALADISFSVGDGQSCVLVGKSGSGKTTLLNCIGALERPDSGRIFCNGMDICTFGRKQRALFQRRQVGFVFQSGNLLPWLTVAENLRFPLELNNIRGKEQKARIAELLATFGLPGYDRALPGELSGGETQRVAFARAIAHHPALLLADEPTASLDSATGYQLVQLMLALAVRRQTTLIIATHDSELIGLTGTARYLKDGRMEV
jgi:ABC-type lipoprotein export system ATPase subunit